MYIERWLVQALVGWCGTAAAETQVYDIGSNPAPWTAEEQKLLEQAMRTYPGSDPDRWDKIADCIPCRTKKDCMKRYKVCLDSLYSFHLLLYLLIVTTMVACTGTCQ